MGATGTWDASHRWDLALQARTASLGVASTLATASFQAAGAGTVSLSPGVQVDSDDTPVLSLAVSKVAAPNLLAASGSVRVASQEKQGETAFGYDANGNTTSEVSPSQSVTYTWDPENRLLTVETDGETETYAYAATGLRRKKTTGAGTTNFVWDDVDLLAELDASLATVAQYTDWPGQWGGLSGARRSGGSQFFGFDLSANTRVLMDAAAGVTDAYLYSAFGTEVRVSGASTNPFRFGGQVGYYRDLAERLYVRARHLQTGLGRWLSADYTGLYSYQYQRNEPLGGADPTGHESLLDYLAWLAGSLSAFAAGLQRLLRAWRTGSGTLQEVVGFLKRWAVRLGKAGKWLGILNVAITCEENVRHCNTKCCTLAQCLAPCFFAISSLAATMLSLIEGPVAGLVMGLISLGISVFQTIAQHRMESHHCYT